MSKAKAIIFGVIVLLFFSMGVTIQQLSRNNRQLKADKERLWNNNLAISAENRQYIRLIYTKDEFIRVMSDSLKSALDSLKIRPKEVTKIVYKYITDIDTVEKPVYVTQFANYKWAIADTGQCFVWKGTAILTDDSLNVKRTYFSYQNSTTDYYYQIRPHKFWFLRWGKKQIKQVTVPKCGTSTEKIIEVIK